MALTVADITALAALVTTERLDSLECDPATGAIRITKSLHAPLPMAARPATPPGDEDDDEDDLLFHSADPGGRAV